MATAHGNGGDCLSLEVLVQSNSLKSELKWEMFKIMRYSILQLLNGTCIDLTSEFITFKINFLYTTFHWRQYKT